MERIIHGHYADPNSTRDIVGITPGEYEVLVEALQFYLKMVDSVVKASPEQRYELAKMSAIVDDNTIDQKELEQNAAEIIAKLNDENVTNLFATKYGTAYTILTTINQPYPGASYNPPE